VTLNEKLYLLLRLSKWNCREHLKGRIAAALWLRHIAEVLRLGFEDVYEVHWKEEFEGGQKWPKEIGERLFGSHRPLDNELKTIPYLVSFFGLHKGSTVRWYIEGYTELGSISGFLSGAAGDYGIEIVNLKGCFGRIRGNAKLVLDLRSSLEEDKRLKRFSMISFDTDNQETRKQISKLIKDKCIVGSLHPHSPDFEFANFSLEELIQALAQFDEESGYDSTPFKEPIAGIIENARHLEKFYCKLTLSNRTSLKGEDWGHLLGRLAKLTPFNSDGKKRPIIEQISNAIRSRRARYDYHIANYKLNQESFILEVVDRKPKGGVSSE